MKITFFKASKVQDFSPEEKERMERAYRRGYFHGAAACYDEMINNKKDVSIRDWIYEDLQSWMLSDKLSKTLPPDCN